MTVIRSIAVARLPDSVSNRSGPPSLVVAAIEDYRGLTDRNLSLIAVKNGSQTG
jgi:hypothetical protein